MWHVDLSPMSPVLSRMCGAWVMNDEPVKVELLTRDRLVVSSPAGMEALVAISGRTNTVDLESTIDQVVAERDRLLGLFDALPPSRRKTLVAPRWPHLPTYANNRGGGQLRRLRARPRFRRYSGGRGRRRMRHVPPKRRLGLHGTARRPVTAQWPARRRQSSRAPPRSRVWARSVERIRPIAGVMASAARRHSV